MILCEVVSGLADHGEDRLRARACVRAVTMEAAIGKLRNSDDKWCAGKHVVPEVPLGSPLPRLHRDGPGACHICAGT